MKIVNKILGEIKPYDKNAKEHPQEQIERIANSIREFGFRTPIVIDKDNVIIQGHGRRLASEFLGLAEVPCVVVDDLNDEQINMLRLADNKVAESDWDLALLDEELLELSDLFTISDYGFSFGVDDADFEVDLPTGDRDPIQTMTFTVSDEQHEIIQDAIQKAKEFKPEDPGGVNDNGNGNALYYIAEFFNNQVES